MTSNIGTVWCQFLCHDHDCVLFHDLYHILGRHNSIDSEIGSGSGTVVDTVEKEQVVDTVDTGGQVVAGSSFAASFAASVASVA